jgi:prophage antirepressor-like protein
LWISNVSDAVSRLDFDEKNTIVLNEGIRGNPTSIIINESGLYNLILGSRKPEAKAFKKWITSEVIPQIRKTGTYGVQKELSRKELALMVIEAEEAKEKLQALLAEQAPKVALAERCLTAVNSQSVTEVAKCLGIGRNKLFAKLRESEVFTAHNLPYQYQIDLGRFEVKEHTIKMGDNNINYPQTFVTAKGLDFIRGLLDSNQLEVSK